MLCVKFVLIDELTILTFQLELGEFAPGLEPLEFVSGDCSSNWYINDSSLPEKLRPEKYIPLIRNPIGTAC